MKVLLINLCIRVDTPKKIYPVGLSYIASAIHRENYELEILNIDTHRYSNTEIEAILKEKDFDVVGFGCIVTKYNLVKDLCAMIKSINKNVTIIVGNSVATAIPQILLTKTKADIAVMGEGDITIVEVLNCLDKGRSLEEVDGLYFKNNGNIIATQPRKPIENLDTIPMPAWDLFEMDLYLRESKIYVSEPYPIPKEEIRAFPVNTARGCIFKCSFCYHVFRENKYRFRSPTNIIKEIKTLIALYKVNYINFWDELTFFSKKQAEALIDALLEANLGIFWTATCRSDLFKNEEDIILAKKFKKAGCVGLGYSLESANATILKSMNKFLKREDFLMQKRILDKAGIITWTSIVLGYPEETEETIDETMEFCYENDIYPSAGFLLPQPGTPIYRYALDNGFITNEEEYLLSLGDRQDLRLNMTKIPSDKFEKLIKVHLDRINKKMDLGLKNETLLKVGHYKAKSIKP